MPDAVVIGAGHNGLVAAVLLARAGLRVEVVEADDMVGGACRTERPFRAAPRLAASTGAYLLGPMPPELLRLLQLRLPLIRRDPHYFLPLPDQRYLLLGGDAGANRRQLVELVGEDDARANDALATELAAIREELAPAWLAEPLTVEATAERYLRPGLRQRFVELVRGSAMDYLQRFGFRSPLLPAMYAITDGMPGLTGSPWSPGSGHNLLVHSMCRLPGADGTWMVVRGGMGTVTGELARAATAAGATIRTGTGITAIEITGGAARGVVTAAGEFIPAPVVLVATDPYRLRGLLGDHLPAPLAARLERAEAASPGQTMKVNLALAGLPRFAALGEERGQHGTTVHLLPDAGSSGGELLARLRETFDDAAAGRLPERPPVEWYLHSTLDPSLRDADGHHSSALFVQGVPHEVAGSGWAAAKDGYVERLLDIVAEYAPGIRSLLVDVDALAPPDIAARFGITGGNIFHVNNTVSFTDRIPYATGVAGVYTGAAGTFPAGSVIGAAGHNAARTILDDLGRAAPATR